jgi:hypothetical protein
VNTITRQHWKFFLNKIKSLTPQLVHILTQF